MNYPSLELASSFVVLFFSLLIIARNPRDHFHLSFAGGFFLLFIGTLADFFGKTGLNWREASWLITLSDLCWGMALACFLQSALLFSRHPWGEKKFLLIAIYLLPGIMLLSLPFGYSHYRGFVSASFGLRSIPELTYLFFLLVCGIYLAVIIYLFNKVFLISEPSSRKEQALFLSSAFILPVLSGFIPLVASLFIDINFPNLLNLSVAFGAGLVGWAIWHHQLFRQYPDIAANTIFTAFPDLLLAADAEEKISLLNDKFQGLFANRPLIGRPLEELIGPENSAKLRHTVLLRGNSLNNLRLTLGGEILQLNCGPIRDFSGEVIGLVLIGREISERARNEATITATTLELQRNLTELNRLNRLLHDQEMDIISLNNELTSLRKRAANG